MTFATTAGTPAEAFDMKVCVCGHVRGVHFRAQQCKVEYCDCRAFDTHDSQPLDRTRWPEGAEI
jgi:hypothetical protein